MLAPNAKVRKEIVPKLPVEDDARLSEVKPTPALSPRSLLLSYKPTSDQCSFASRIDWASLLRLVYNIDALACPCGGRIRFEELVTDKEAIRGALGFGPDDLAAASKPSLPSPKYFDEIPDEEDLPPPTDDGPFPDDEAHPPSPREYPDELPNYDD